MSLFEAAGGEAGIKAVLRTFYDAVFDDVMIGFFFARADKERLIQKEYELTAAALGAPGVSYTGKKMGAAHAGRGIFGGQFERRQQLLREALERHGVPLEVREAWMAHAESLRDQITRNKGSDCD